MKSIKLTDGRVLAYRDYGDPDGQPVLFVHGFADSGVVRYYDDAYTAAIGARIIAPDLPGVGGSSPDRGRTVSRWAGDARQLVDQLGLEKFGVAGVSSGGSHAMSVAHALPDRVTRLSLASPTPRFDDPEVWKFINSDQLKNITRLHRMGMLFLLRPLYAYLSYKSKRNQTAFVRESMFSYFSDAEGISESPEQYEIFKENFLAGVAHAGAGMYETTCADMHPWGFEMSDIRQPVTLFYGDKADLIAPEISHHIAAQLPNSKICFWPNCGRYGFVRRDRWTQFISAALAPLEDR